jgi:hypothetical protein
MMRSASMYNSPYTYKPPPPKIDYPSFFYGCTGPTCSHILDSKLLALSVLILFVADLVIVAMLIPPFWFVLVFDKTEGTFGSQPVVQKLSINSGLFFLNEDEFDNWVFTDTFSGRDALPKQLQTAQFFAVFGSCILVPCFVGGIILMLRRLASPTGLYIMAAAVTLGAVCEILVILFCGAVAAISSCDPYDGSKCVYKDNLAWRMMPVYSQLYRIEPDTRPYVKANWAFYIAIIGAGLAVAAAVLFWIEAFLTGGRLGQIRYQQLRQARDPFEHDVTYTGKKNMYQPPVRQGLNTYGMQPVVHSSVRYDGQVLPYPRQQDYGEYTPPASLAPPSPRYERKAGPPSTISSTTSGPFVSREIDL